MSSSTTLIQPYTIVSRDRVLQQTSHQLPSLTSFQKNKSTKQLDYSSIVTHYNLFSTLLSSNPVLLFPTASPNIFYHPALTIHTFCHPFSPAEIQSPAYLPPSKSFLPTLPIGTQNCNNSMDSDDLASFLQVNGVLSVPKLAHW